MNDKIKNIENLISENEAENKRLQELLRNEIYNYFESIGIPKNGKVKVKQYSDDYEEGIFVNLKFEYGRWKPVVMKIKKDGTAHSTATVYCYSIENIKPTTKQ